MAHLIVKQSTPSSTECDLRHPQVQMQKKKLKAGEVAVFQRKNAQFESLSGRKLQNFLAMSKVGGGRREMSRLSVRGTSEIRI